MVDADPVELRTDGHIPAQITQPESESPVVFAIQQIDMRKGKDSAFHVLAKTPKSDGRKTLLIEPSKRPDPKNSTLLPKGRLGARRASTV